MDDLRHLWRCVAFFISIGCGVWAFAQMDSSSLVGFVVRLAVSLLVALLVAVFTGASKLAGDHNV